MSNRCKVSSLSLALLLTACGGDDGSDDTSAAATTSSSTSSTTTGPAASTSGAPITTGVGATTGEPTTTTDGPATTTGGDSSTGEDACADSVLTWDNFGESFMLTWCTGCHHADLPSAERACAPCSTNFDSHAGVSERAGIIKLRALDSMDFDGVTPMPPATIVPDAELALLREWIDCGAPGPQTGEKGPACPDPDTKVTCP